MTGSDGTGGTPTPAEPRQAALVAQRDPTREAETANAKYWASQTLQWINEAKGRTSAILKAAAAHRETSATVIIMEHRRARGGDNVHESRRRDNAARKAAETVAEGLRQDGFSTEVVVSKVWLWNQQDSPTYDVYAVRVSW